MRRRGSIAVLLGGGALCGALLLTARAQPPDEVIPPARRHLLCRHFVVDLGSADGGMFETSDQTEEIGQWVAMHESVGWRMATSDFEIGQKATGSMVGWTQICLERTH